MKEDQIRKMVRDQIRLAIEDDLEGGEALMKEVWERLEDDVAVDLAKDEMRAICRHLKQG